MLIFLLVVAFVLAAFLAIGALSCFVAAKNKDDVCEKSKMNKFGALYSVLAVLIICAGIFAITII